MLNFVCINWNDYCGRGVEYVNCLADMVRRNLSEGTPGVFTVFTNSPGEYADGVVIRSLPVNFLRGWYNKIALFQHGLFDDGDRIVFLDLDTVITGPLDAIAAYSGPFAILRDAYRPNGLQSSVMAWGANNYSYIWDDYTAVDYPEISGGDQAWIERSVTNPIILQKQFPGSFVSYKRDARYGIPPGSSVCFFHGEPRPHECDGWVAKLWKVGAANNAQLELVGNTTSDIIKANIHRSETLSANWLKTVEPHDGVALICAGGPSIRDEIPSITTHVTLGAKIFACNNVPRLLGAFGVNSDYHVMLDARPENLEFASGVGPKTQCLYASQCDEGVHGAAGKRLILWHPAFEGVIDIVGADKARDYIGGGTTCGMKAATLAWAMGYRKIHLYGFDSCYRENEHHAYAQKLNDGEKILDVEYNGKSYKCSPWMVQQAEDFEMFIPQLIDHGTEVTVHGSGLIPDISKELAKGHFRLEAADFRAHAILERLDGVAFPKVAEIGVFAGDLSRRLLARRQDLELVMVDSWAEAPKAEYAASEDFHATLSAKEQDEYCALADKVTSFAHQRRTIMRMDSRRASKRIPDQSLDLVFIDADHSYEGCRDDIQSWYSKVKLGGIISGHDYANDDFAFGPMVKRAVDEFIKAKGLTLELGENYTWFATKQRMVA